MRRGFVRSGRCGCSPRPPPAQLVGLGVHHVVRDLLGEAPEQLLHIDGAVVETGLGEHVWRRV